VATPTDCAFSAICVVHVQYQMEGLLST